MKRDVGEDFVRRSREWRGEGVALHDGDVWQVVEVFVEPRDHARVLLHSDNLRAATRQYVGDDAATGSEVVDGICFAQVAMTDECFDDTWAS